MSTLEFIVDGHGVYEYEVKYWTEDLSTGLAPIKREGAPIVEGIVMDAKYETVDSIEELDNFILPLKSKYDQVIQILPNGKRKVI